MSILKLVLGLVPIIWLIIALSGLKMPGFKACPLAIIFAAAVALIYKKMAPVHVATAIVEGVCMALWPILLVIIAALFVYNLVQATGAMDKIKANLIKAIQDKTNAYKQLSIKDIVELSQAVKNLSEIKASDNSVLYGFGDDNAIGFCD